MGFSLPPVFLSVTLIIWLVILIACAAFGCGCYNYVTRCKGR